MKILKIVPDKASSLKTHADSAEQKNTALLTQIEEMKKENAEKSTAFETLTANLKQMTAEMTELKAHKEKSVAEVTEWETKLGEMTSKLGQVTTKLEAVEVVADSDAIYVYIDAFGGAMRSLHQSGAEEAFLCLKAEFEAYIISHPLLGLPLPVGDLRLTLPEVIEIEIEETALVTGEKEVMAEETAEVDDVAEVEKGD